MKASNACPRWITWASLILTLGLLLVAAAAVYADVQNGGFETGDFTGWTPSGSHAIVSAGMDPWIPSLSRVYDGQYAAQIGDTSPVFPISATWESKIQQTASVPDVDPVLELHHAAVALEAHPSGESAGYALEVVDLTTGASLYSVISYAWDTGVGNPPPPDWTRQVTIPANSLDFSPWQTVRLDLDGHEGHQIRIEYRVFDCVHGEHWAYGYLDSVFLQGQAQPTPTPTTEPAAPPVVPEPPTLVLFASAAAGMAGYIGLQWRARRRK